MDYVNVKGRPVTRQTLKDINALFAIKHKGNPIPKPLQARLEDAGVEWPTPLVPYKGTR